MNIENEQLKLKLIETQAALLQYQHREINENISRLQLLADQAAHDAAADARDIPSGATTQPDAYTGS